MTINYPTYYAVLQAAQAAGYAHVEELELQPDFEREDQVWPIAEYIEHQRVPFGGHPTGDLQGPYTLTEHTIWDAQRAPKCRLHGTVLVWEADEGLWDVESPGAEAQVIQVLLPCEDEPILTTSIGTYLLGNARVPGHASATDWAGLLAQAVALIESKRAIPLIPVP